MTQSISPLPQPLPPALASAVFKRHPSDFVVKEILHITPSGQGEHLWLQICKVNLNTAFVAHLLADWAGIPVRDVGYSGLKDRYAMTYQWFSLRLPKRTLPTADFDELSQHLQDHERLEIICHAFHDKKLGRGTHKANHFIITLHDVHGDRAMTETALETIKRVGVPNYFGMQRFGREGGNLAQAERFFERLLSDHKAYRPAKKERTKHALYISAAKSQMFNALLATRIQVGCYDTPVAGDVFNLDGSGSIFSAQTDDEITSRLADQDIHIAGLMYGTGERLSSQQARSLEAAIMAEFGLFVAGLDKIGTSASYRPLRLKVQDLTWVWQGDQILTLQFALTSGSFATSVLSALVYKLIDASPS